MLKIVIDPTNSYPKDLRGGLMDATGLIPYFIAEAAEETTARGVYDVMVEAYGFGGHEMDGGSVSSDGTYSYPEDPDLAPLVSFELDAGFVYVYQYGIVGIASPNETIVTRMD